MSPRRTIKLPFIPSSLRELREIAGCSLEEAAKRVQKDVDTVRKWESDAHAELPTYSQARQLGKLYRYDPLLCLREIPAHIKPPELPDFRTIDKNGIVANDFSRNMRWLLRNLETRIEFVTEYGSYWELKHQGWVASESIETIDAESLATKMREMLGVDVETQRSWPGVNEALKNWISAFNEYAGVFVCQTSNQKGSAIELDEMRGLSAGDPVAPFIVVNSKDAEAGRIFTLFHELAHLCIGKSGISAWSGLEYRSAQGDRQDDVEAYCDEAAANALMPSSEFEKHWPIDAHVDLMPTVTRQADFFKVSREAVSLRAVKLGRISWSDYAAVKKELDANRRLKPDTKPEVKRSGGDPYNTHIRNLGRKYVGLVLATWLDGQIGIKEAGRYLHLKPAQVYPLASKVGFRT